MDLKLFCNEHMKEDITSISLKEIVIIVGFCGIKIITFKIIVFLWENQCKRDKLNAFLQNRSV